MDEKLLECIYDFNMMVNDYDIDSVYIKTIVKDHKYKCVRAYGGEVNFICENCYTYFRFFNKHFYFNQTKFTDYKMLFYISYGKMPYEYHMIFSKDYLSCSEMNIKDIIE